VFGDLQPYICIAEECVRPDCTFSRRRDWIDHQMHHLSDSDRMDCPFCGGNYLNTRGFWKHIANHQEQLALFVLGEGEVDSGDESQEEGYVDSDSEPERGGFHEETTNTLMEGAESLNPYPDVTVYPDLTTTIRPAPDLPSSVKMSSPNPPALQYTPEYTASMKSALEKDYDQLLLQGPTFYMPTKEESNRLNASSYWSVEEDIEFQVCLLAHGTNFPSFAATLPKKTLVMVSFGINRY
jgi:hypothetical protein